MAAEATPRNEFEALCLINRADHARALGQIAQADRLLLLAWMAYEGVTPVATGASLPAADAMPVHSG